MTPDPDDKAPPPIGAALRAVVLDAGAQQSAHARELVAASLQPAIQAAAATLHDHPLAVAQLTAKMLLEQLFALDAKAAKQWTDAAVAEETAQSEETRRLAQRARFAAFQQLAAAAAANDANRYPGPFDLRHLV